MKPAKPSKVLVPVDNSKNSWRVIDHAIKFAKTTGAEITVLYVVSGPITSSIFFARKFCILSSA